MNASTAEWARSSNRVTLFRSLLKDSLLCETLWRLLFQSAPSLVAARQSDGSPVPSFGVKWQTERLSIAFPRARHTLADGSLTPQMFDYLVVDPLATHELSGRLFPVQTDGYLCGVHSINALARCVLLNPASFYEHTSYLRSIDMRVSRDLYAQREDLVFACLREGVVLANICLNSAVQLYSEDNEFPLKRNRVFERAVRSASGMAILLSSQSGESGHFITVVPTTYDTWLVYSGTAVESTHDTLCQALIYVTRRMRNDNDKDVVGLLPLLPSSDAFTRSWIQSTLRNTTIETSASGAMLLNAPLFKPLALHSAALAMSAVQYQSSMNLVTFFAAKHRFEDELNEKANEIAAFLKPSAINRHVYNVETDAKELDALLAQLASLVRCWVAILFAPIDVLANRDWFRYVVVYYVATQLRGAIKTNPTNILAWLQTAAALCAVAFTWHKEAGESQMYVARTYRGLSKLYHIAHTTSLEAVFGPLHQSTAFEQRVAGYLAEDDKPADFVGRAHIDRCIWLLYAAKHRGVALHLSDAALLQLDCGTFDDCQTGSDFIAPLNALRQLAFQLPSYKDACRMERVAKQAIDATNVIGQRALKIERRKQYAAAFAQMYDRVGSDPIAKEYLMLFGVPPNYAGKPSDDDIDAFADAHPVFVEQACIQSSAVALYGAVFDYDHDCCVLRPDVPHSARLVVEGDAVDVDTATFDDLPPFVNTLKRRLDA